MFGSPPRGSRCGDLVLSRPGSIAAAKAVDVVKALVRQPSGHRLAADAVVAANDDVAFSRGLVQQLLHRVIVQGHGVRDMPGSVGTWIPSVEDPQVRVFLYQALQAFDIQVSKRHKGYVRSFAS